MNKKAIELIRVSTEGQAADDRGGIPAQRASNRKTAAQHGLEIVRTIEMSDVSGTAVLRAPEMQELLRMIESPNIHGVVAREFSRLMRPERFEDFALLQVFADSGTILYLPEGPIDLSSKAGSLMGGIRALMAGWERREILERMNGAKEAMRRAGQHPGGAMTLPLGVGYSEGQGWFYKPEAQKIRQAYEMVANTGKPYAEIARLLNLPRTSLQFILQNPIYTGYRVYDQKRDPSSTGYVASPNGRQGYRRKIKRAPDEIIRVKVMEGLVSEKLFRSVQEILASRAAREWAIRNKNAPQYMFNGFLRCGVCGNPMYTHTSKDLYYNCKRNGTRARLRDPNGACPTPYVRAAVLEPKIEELLSVKMRDRTFLRQVAEEYEAKARKGRTKLDAAAIQKQIKILKAKHVRIMDSFVDGVIDRAARDQRLRAVDADLASYEAMLAESAPEVNEVSLGDWLSYFAELPFLERDQKRAALRHARVEVFVNGYTITGMKFAVGNGDGNTANPGRAAGA